MKFKKMQFDINSIKNNNMEIMFNSICGICGVENDDIGFAFGILNEKGRLNFYMAAEEQFIPILEKKIEAIYPEIEYDNFKDCKYLFQKNSKFCKLNLMYSMEKRLIFEGQEEIFIKNLLTNLYKKDNNFISLVEISMRPICLIQKPQNKKQKIGKGILKGMRFLLDSVFYDDSNYYKNYNNNSQQKQNQTKELKFCYEVSIKVATHSKNKNTIFDLQNIAYTFSQLNYENIFKIKYVDKTEMFDRKKYDFKLSTKEIIQFIELPNNKILEDILDNNLTKNLIDKNVPNKGIVIGTNNNIPLAIAAPVGLSPDKLENIYKDNEKIIEDICKPKLCLGVQGTGKSEWIVNYAIQCIKNGIPVIIIDPKNDTQKRFIESVPEEYLKTIDYLNLGDLLFPPALNVFRKRKQNDATENSLIVTSFISYMKKQFGSSWGWRIQQIIQMTTEAILLDDTTTLSEFMWMLTEKEYREYIIQKMELLLNEPDIKGKSHIKKLLKYWKDFNEQPEKIIKREVEPTLNKIGIFIGNRFINSIVCQRESYDFRKNGDAGRSVVINLPEGIINPENMNLLSGFINKAIWVDYQSRDDVELCKRYPVQWIIDEAHTLVDDDFIGILTKSRSRRLGILLATQSLSNFNIRGGKMSDMISDNCKTKFLFKIGMLDARNFIDEFEPLTVSDLNDCPDYHFYAKTLLEDGSVSKPFFVHALPVAKKLRNYDEFKENNHFGRLTIDEIEDDIDNRLDRIKIANKLAEI